MTPYSPFVAVLQGIPEALAMVFLAYALLGLRTIPVRVLVLGLLSITLIFLIRASGAPFPAHTLFNLVVIPVVLSVWEQIRLKAAALGWALTVGLILVLESIAYAGLTWAGIAPETIVADKCLSTLAGLPHVGVTALIAVWMRRRGGLKFLKEIRSI